MMKITDVHQAWQLLLTESAQEHGMRSGWHQRHGSISASQFVQTLTFGFLEDPHATLRHLTRVACRLGAEITPSALSQRLTEESHALLRGVVQDAMGMLLETEPLEVAWLRNFMGGVWLNDSTQIAWHDDWASQWDGGGTAAALKLPVLMDVLNGRLQVDMTAARQHDSATVLANLDFPHQSVVIEDLGYLDGARIQTRLADQVYTVIPCRCTMVFQNAGGQQINLLGWLKRHRDGGLHERTVWWQAHPYRLVAIPLPPETAERKRHGIITAAQKHGRTPHPRALYLADWLIVITTLPVSLASPQHVALLMRMRWQIELLFKFWKDQGKLDETRGWNPARIATEFYAKLLGLLLQHWTILTTGWEMVERSMTLMGQAFREEIRSICGMWQDLAAFTRWCEQLSRIILKTARIASHAHQQSTSLRILTS